MDGEYAFKSRTDFLASVREKYPEYNSADDSALYAGLIEKFPEYAGQIEENFNAPPPVQSAESTDVNTRTDGMPETWVGPKPKGDITALPEYGKYQSLLAKGDDRRGFWEGLTDFSAKDAPFVGGFFQASEINNALATYKKLEKGQDVSDEELLKFNIWKSISERAENANWKGKAGDIIRQNIAFWTEIAAGTLAVLSVIPGDEAAAIGAKAGSTTAKVAAEAAKKKFFLAESERIGSAVTKKAQLNAVQKMAYNRSVNAAVGTAIREDAGAGLAKVLTTGLAKAGVKVAPKAVQAAAGTLASAEAGAAPAAVSAGLSAKTIELAAKGMSAMVDAGIKGVVLTATQPDNVQASIAQQRMRQYFLTGSEDEKTAVLMGIADAVKENATEMMGWTLGKAMNRVVPAAAQNNVIYGMLFQGVMPKLQNKTMNGFLTWARLGGANGIVEEMYEERIAGFVGGLFGLEGDDRAGLTKAIENTFPGLEQLKSEALAFALPGMIHGTGRFLEGTKMFGGIGWDEYNKQIADLNLRIDAETDPVQRIRLEEERDAAVEGAAKTVESQRIDKNSFQGKLKTLLKQPLVRANGINDLLMKSGRQTTDQVAEQAERLGVDPVAAVKEHLKQIIGGQAYIVKDVQRAGEVADRIERNEIELARKGRFEGIWTTPAAKYDQHMDQYAGEPVIPVGTAKEMLEFLQKYPPMVVNLQSMLTTEAGATGTTEFSAWRKLMPHLPLAEAKQFYEMLFEMNTIGESAAEGQKVGFKFGHPFIVADKAGAFSDLNYAVPGKKADAPHTMVLGASNEKGWVVFNRRTMMHSVIEDFAEARLESFLGHKNIMLDGQLAQLSNSINDHIDDLLATDPKNKQLKAMKEWGATPGKRFEQLGKLYINGRLGITSHDREMWSALKLTPEEIEQLDALYTEIFGKNLLAKLMQNSDIKVNQSKKWVFEERKDTKPADDIPMVFGEVAPVDTAEEVGPQINQDQYDRRVQTEVRIAVGQRLEDAMQSVFDATDDLSPRFTLANTILFDGFEEALINQDPEKAEIIARRIVENAEAFKEQDPGLPSAPSSADPIANKLLFNYMMKAGKMKRPEAEQKVAAFSKHQRRQMIKAIWYNYPEVDYYREFKLSAGELKRISFSLTEEIQDALKTPLEEIPYTKGLMVSDPEGKLVPIADPTKPVYGGMVAATNRAHVFIMKFPAKRVKASIGGSGVVVSPVPAYNVMSDLKNDVQMRFKPGTDINKVYRRMLAKLKQRVDLVTEQVEAGKVIVARQDHFQESKMRVAGVTDDQRPGPMDAARSADASPAYNAAYSQIELPGIDSWSVYRLLPVTEDPVGLSDPFTGEEGEITGQLPDSPLANPNVDFEEITDPEEQAAAGYRRVVEPETDDFTVPIPRQEFKPIPEGFRLWKVTQRHNPRAEERKTIVTEILYEGVVSVVENGDAAVVEWAVVHKLLPKEKRPISTRGVKFTLIKENAAPDMNLWEMKYPKPDSTREYFAPKNMVGETIVRENVFEWIEGQSDMTAPFETELLDTIEVIRDPLSDEGRIEEYLFPDRKAVREGKTVIGSEAGRLSVYASGDTSGIADGSYFSASKYSMNEDMDGEDDADLNTAESEDARTQLDQGSLTSRALTDTLWNVTKDAVDITVKRENKPLNPAYAVADYVNTIQVIGASALLDSAELRSLSAVGGIRLAKIGRLVRDVDDWRKNRSIRADHKAFSAMAAAIKDGDAVIVFLGHDFAFQEKTLRRFYSRAIEQAVNGKAPIIRKQPDTSKWGEEALAKYEADLNEEMSNQLSAPLETPANSYVPLLIIHEDMSPAVAESAMRSFMIASGVQNVTLINGDEAYGTDGTDVEGAWINDQAIPAFWKALFNVTGYQALVDKDTYKHTSEIDYVTATNETAGIHEAGSAKRQAKRDAANAVVTEKRRLQNARDMLKRGEPLSAYQQALLEAAGINAPAVPTSVPSFSMLPFMLADVAAEVPGLKNFLLDFDMLPAGSETVQTRTDGLRQLYRLVRDISQDAEVAAQKQTMLDRITERGKAVVAGKIPDTSGIENPTFSLTWDNAASSTAGNKEAGIPGWSREAFVALWDPYFQKLKNEPVDRTTDSRVRSIQWPKNKAGEIMLSKALMLADWKRQGNGRGFSLTAADQTAAQEAADEFKEEYDAGESLSLVDLDWFVEQLNRTTLLGAPGLQHLLITESRKYRERMNTAIVNYMALRHEVGAQDKPHTAKKDRLSDSRKELGKLLLRAIGARQDGLNMIPVGPDWNGPTTLMPDGSTRRNVLYERQNGSEISVDEVYAQYNAQRLPGSRTAEEIAEAKINAIAELRREMNEAASILSDEEWIRQREDYITHMYRSSTKRDKENIDRLLGRRGEASGRTMERKFPSYIDAAKAGLTPLNLDVGFMEMKWVESTAKIHMNRMMMNFGTILQNEDGSPVMVAVPSNVFQTVPTITDEFLRQTSSQLAAFLGVNVPQGDLATQLKTLTDQLMNKHLNEYEVMKSPFPSISTIYVHKGPAMNFAKMFLGSPFAHPVMQKLEHANAWMKTLAIGMPYVSLFHPFAQIESMLATYGLKDNPIIKPEFWTDLFQLRRPEVVRKAMEDFHNAITNPAMTGDWISDGLEISFGNPNISNHGVVDADIQGWIDQMKENPTTLNKTMVKGLSAFLGSKQKWDKWLWQEFNPTLKLHMAQNILEKRLAQAAERNEYVDLKDMRQKIAKYVNNSMGGTEWEQYVWATPIARQVMHLMMFAPDWTISSFNVSGLGALPVIRDVLGAPPSSLEMDEIMKSYWPAMFVLVMMGIPNALQLGIWLATRIGGDPDDQPFNFLNEPGKKTYVDVTPLVRHLGFIPGVGYEGGDTGKRRVYLRWGKQSYEVVDGWVTKPYETLLGKTSQAVKLAFEQATGTTMNGYDLPYKDKGLAGTLSVEGSFLDSRVGYVVRKFSPYFVLNFIDGMPSAFFAPASRGASKSRVIETMENIMAAFADDETFNKVADMGKVSNLHNLVSEAYDGALVNGYDAEELFHRATANVRSSYYIKFFDAINAGNHKKTEQIAQAIVRLNGNIETVNRSMGNKFKASGKVWSSESMSARTKQILE